MNSNQINNNDNYFGETYNPSKSVNLMKYVNNINRINQYYTREKDINIDNEDKDKNKDNTLEDKEIIPERSLSNYINNPFLSDAILKLNDFEFYFHKIILCPCSDYINNIISSNSEQKENNEINNNENKNENENKNDNKIDNKGKLIINFPEIIFSSFGGGNSKICIEKILKYCYNNQDFKSIESDINQYNIFTLLELSHCLGIKSLKLNIERKISKNYLDNDNSVKLLLESKIFDLPNLNKECIKYIIKNFKYVKIFKKDILEFDFDTFKKIISSDELNIDDEKDVSDFVINYIKSRRELPEENVEKINDNNNKEGEEKKEEEEKKDEEKKNDEIQKEEKKEINENEKWNNYLKELKKSNKKKKLTKEEEKELILCIRFNNLSHPELIRLTNESIMDEYKDLLLNALSMKLNNYEETQNADNKIFNHNPRLYSQKPNNENNNNNNLYYSHNNFNNRNNLDIMNNKSIPNSKFSTFPKSQNIFNNNMNDDENYDYNENIFNNNPINYEYNKSYKKNNLNRFNNVEDYHNINNNDNYNNIEFNENNNEENERDILNSQYFNINNKKEKEKINRYRQMIKSEEIKKPKNIEQVSLSSSNNQLIIPSNYNIKFKYKKDFDTNGALYYLGTYGLSRKYENPHDLKLVKAFGSSLLSGQYGDFVGREIVNLCTENEENSFFGVDLGPDRYLLPTLYSIRNRDSSSNVLLSWNLQGSNDKINFVILDRRTFNYDNNSNNINKYKKYRNLLKEPKTTSTWGISRKIKENYPNGFRYFLLKQIGKNSSGNYNLTNSGFELYGEGIGNGWNFA